MLILVAKLIGCIAPEFVDILLTATINSVWVILAEFIDWPLLMFWLPN